MVDKPEAKPTRGGARPQICAECKESVADRVRIQVPRDWKLKQSTICIGCLETVAKKVGGATVSETLTLWARAKLEAAKPLTVARLRIAELEEQNRRLLETIRNNTEKYKN